MEAAGAVEGAEGADAAKDRRSVGFSNKGVVGSVQAALTLMTYM